MTTPYSGPGAPDRDGAPSFQKPPSGPAPYGSPGPGAAPQQYGIPPQQYGDPQQQTTPGAVPPGWYPGPSGGPQWWDGRGWGPTAPPANDNSSTFALFSHLGTLIAGFLVPLIILLTEGKKNRFVKHHATEALNFSITTGIASLVMLVLYFLGFFVAFAGGVGSRNAGVAAGVIIVVIVLFVVLLFTISIGSLVCTIIGTVKAGQRKYWRYPLCIRLVRGAASKEEIAALNTGTVQ